MQREAERLVLFFDLTLEAYSVSRAPGLSAHGLTPKPLQTLLGWIKAISTGKNGLLAWTRRDDKEVIYLADIDIDASAQYATLLINRCDKRASDIVFFNPESDTRRRISRQPGEGADYSSHAVISLRESAPNQFLVLIEQSPGLGSGRVESFINYLFRAAGAAHKGQLVVLHPSGISVGGKPYKVRIRHRCRLDGHPSASFVQDLNSGELREMELISTAHKNSQWDAHGYLVEKAKVVKVTQGRTGIVGSKMAAIKNLCDMAAAQKYEKVKVRFKTASELNRTVTLNAITKGLAQDSMYVRRETIEGFSSPLPSAFDAINTEIRDKLASLL